MERYTISKLNSRFIVTNRQSSNLDAHTDQGTPADITKPAEVKYFGLTLKDADALADKLNGR